MPDYWVPLILRLFSRHRPTPDLNPPAPIQKSLVLPESMSPRTGPQGWANFFLIRHNAVGNSRNSPLKVIPPTADRDLPERRRLFILQPLSIRFTPSSAVIAQRMLLASTFIFLGNLFPGFHISFLRLLRPLIWRRPFRPLRPTKFFTCVCPSVLRLP